MGVELIVTNRIDKDFEQTGDEIFWGDWDSFVKSEEHIRYRTEPYSVKNPMTNEVITIAVPEGSTEVSLNGEWFPFLRYSSGELSMGYISEFDEPDNPLRKVVAYVANHFSALITHDAGDEILEW